MATRGAKPTATILKLVAGNPGKRRLPVDEPQVSGRPRAPEPMSGRPLALWRRYIVPAYWLGTADGPKAWLWCHLQAEVARVLNQPDINGPEWLEMAGKAVAAGLPVPDRLVLNSAMIAQLRALGSELGFDPGSRARLGADKRPGKVDPAARFFK